MKTVEEHKLCGGTIKVRPERAHRYAAEGYLAHCDRCQMRYYGYTAQSAINRLQNLEALSPRATLYYGTSLYYKQFKQSDP